jgi:hypothetical protein
MYQYAETTSFRFGFRETPSVMYGRDFAVGDIVPVRLRIGKENRTFSTTEILRQATFTVKGNTELIEMIVGGGEGVITNGLRLFDRIKKMEYRQKQLAYGYRNPTGD